MKRLILLSLISSFSISSSAEITNSGLSDPHSGPSNSQSTAYNLEIKCILEKLYPNVPQSQKNRAYHFARTLGELTAGWQPALAANWRRHLYAQLVPETTFFAANEEGMPSKSKLADDNYKGRGWIQLTHKENYQQYACFKKALDSGGPTSSLAQLEEYAKTRTLPNECSEYSNIVSNPDAAFKYTEVMDYDQSTDANKNNDLSTIWYFVNKGKEQSAFQKALETKGTDAVSKVRRGVNLGDATKDKVANDEDKAIKAYNDIGSCFPGS